VGCDQYREALSAELDGEPAGMSAERIAGHLDGCAGCRDWQDRAARITRLTRLAPALPMPDLAPLVVPARRPWTAAARAALVAVAFVQALLAWSGALTGQDDMATGHVAHEVGAWNLALAVAFLAAATRPRTAEALVAPVGVFVTVLAVVAVADAAAGDLATGRLAGHLLVAAGLGLLVTVARAGARPVPGTPPAGRARPDLPTGPRPVPSLDAPAPVPPFATATAPPTAHSPAAALPAVRRPAAHRPAAHRPAAPLPAAHRPAAALPAAHRPVAAVPGIPVRSGRRAVVVPMGEEWACPACVKAGGSGAEWARGAPMGAGSAA
jgi:predicted anti-sigma-YlaC factor YlaD